MQPTFSSFSSRILNRVAQNLDWAIRKILSGAKFAQDNE